MSNNASLLSSLSDEFAAWHSRRQYPRSKTPQSLEKRTIELISSGIYSRSDIIKALKISHSLYDRLYTLYVKNGTASLQSDEKEMKMVNIATITHPIEEKIYERIKIEKGDGSVIFFPLSILKNCTIDQIIKSFLC